MSNTPKDAVHSVTNKADNFGNKVIDATSEAAGKAETAAIDAIHSAADKADAFKTRTVHALNDAADVAADKAERFGSAASGAIGDAEKQAVGFIRERPVAATLAALFIGLLVGRLVL